MGVMTLGVTLDGGGLEAQLAGLDGRLSDMSAPMDEFGRWMMGSVGRNFGEGGRPEKWQPLAEATMRRKGSGAPLVDTGWLRSSVVYEAGPAGLSLYSLAGYAAAQQRGTASVPARPFLVFQDEDVQKLREVINGHLLSGR